MFKDDLARAVAARTGLNIAAAKQAIDAFTAVVTERLVAGETVTLVGFGVFKTTDRKERRGVNPQTGEPLTIPAHRSPGFTPGATLKAAVR